MTIVYKAKPEYYKTLYGSYAEGFLAEQTPDWLEEANFWCFGTDWDCDHQLELIAEEHDLTPEQAKEKFFYPIDLDDFGYSEMNPLKDGLDKEIHGEGSLDEFLSDYDIN